MFFVSDDLHNCCGRKQLDRQQKLVNTFYLLAINSILHMQNSFWHKSRSLSVIGWMWHVSAVVSRFLPENEQAGTMESLPNIRVEVSTLETLLTLRNCKINSRMLVQQQQILHHVAWNTCSYLCSYSMMRFVDIMIMAFLGGIESSHGHVLLKMRHKTILIAIIGLVKPCLTGIEC